MEVTNHTSEGFTDLGFKTRADVTRSLKEGGQKEVSCTQITDSLSFLSKLIT